MAVARCWASPVQPNLPGAGRDNTALACHTLEIQLHIGHGLFFDLTYTFRRYPIFRCQFMQGLLVFVQPTALDDVTTAGIQCGQGMGELLIARGFAGMLSV